MLRIAGMVAPMVRKGPINGDWLEAYMTQGLAPEFRPGDAVIMDNLLSHKRVSVRQRIEAAAATLQFLPPYIFDFKPIGRLVFTVNAPLKEERCWQQSKT